MRYLTIIEETKPVIHRMCRGAPQLILTGEVVSLVEFTVYLQKINCDGYS